MGETVVQGRLLLIGRPFPPSAFAGGKERPYLLNAFCQRQGILHKLIRPRTPEHNGKVERSHRIDQERFHRTLSFYSLEDLREQGARWMKRYNSPPRMALRLKTPD